MRLDAPLMTESARAGSSRSVRTLIEPVSGWRPIDWRELAQYRDLLGLLVLRSVKARYAQTVLGVGWAVIQPLVSMIVFTIVFGRLARVSSDGAPYALFSFTALVPWTYFAAAVSDATGSVVASAHIVNKVYFPRLLLPVSAVAAKLLDFGIALLLLLGVVLAAGRVPTAAVLALPVLVVVMVCSAAGCGFWLAALAARYRDVSYATGFLVQLLLYASPVVYPAALVPDAYRWLYALNPMVGVIEGFRAAILGTREMPWLFIAEGAVVAMALAASGALYFRQQEHAFADVA